MDNVIKRVVAETKQRELAEMIIDYANCEKFTITNIEEAVDVVIQHMRDNAILLPEDSIYEQPESPVSVIFI